MRISYFVGLFKRHQAYGHAIGYGDVMAADIGSSVRILCQIDVARLRQVVQVEELRRAFVG